MKRLRIRSSEKVMRSSWKKLSESSKLKIQLREYYFTMQVMTRKSLEAKETRKSFSSPAPKSSGSTSQSFQSTSSGRLCYKCRKPYTKEHEAVCKAKTAKCNGCGEIGHYKNCCMKAGNFPKKPQHTKKMHITGVAEQRVL